MGTRRQIRKYELPKPKTGPWKLAELDSIPANGLTVFSCFHCGGGSTMGYKLAGFKVLGGIEIDSDMMKIYRENHRPDEKFSFLMPIQDFPFMHDDKLPTELFNLDVLDGSPPCSSFSTAGSREDGWNEKKMFREGQTEQVLDDLFFHFIKVADKLRPKIVVAENVKGLIMGNARGYVKEIFDAYSKAGYDTQLFLLNAAYMGVSQARERTFFISRRRDLNLPKFSLEFNEAQIPIKDAFDGLVGEGKALSGKAQQWWSKTPRGGLFSVCGADTGKMNRKLNPARPSWTQTATPNVFHWESPRYITESESVRIQSFPDDYNFLNQKAGYVCGMSVPPFMTQRVALEVARALLANQKSEGQNPKP